MSSTCRVHRNDNMMADEIEKKRRKKSNIFTEEVQHLAKCIIVAYNLFTPPSGSGRVKEQNARERAAIRTPSGRIIAWTFDDFTMMAIRRKWIVYTSDMSIPLTDLEYAIDWDKINRDQRLAAQTRTAITIQQLSQTGVNADAVAKPDNIPYNRVSSRMSKTKPS